MFERYTNPARRLIFFARYEALDDDAKQILSEHLLLGAFRDGKLQIPKLVDASEALKQQLGYASGQGVLRKGELPLANESKRILAYAAEEAERFRHYYILREHLVAGMLRESGCNAAKALQGAGIDLEIVRACLGEMKLETPSWFSRIKHSSVRNQLVALATCILFILVFLFGLVIGYLLHA